MKAFLVLTDAAALPEFERALAGDRGYTVMTTLAGSGRSGMHTGSRVHPGTTVVVLTVADEATAADTARLLAATRDAAGVRDATRIYTFEAREI